LFGIILNSFPNFFLGNPHFGKTFVELQAKLLNYFLGSNKSNINQIMGKKEKTEVGDEDGNVPQEEVGDFQMIAHVGR